MNSRAKPKKNAKFKKRQRQSKTITFEEFVADKGNFVKVRGWARDGLTNDMIADKIGIVSSTLYAWQNRSKEFKEALKKGKEIIDREVEDSLLKRALGTKKSKTIYRMVKVSDEVLKAKRLKFMNIYKLDHPEASKSEIVFEAYDKVSEWTKIPFQVEEEEIVGDVKAMEFWLRNRKPEQFRDKAFNRLNNAQADKMKAEIKRNEAQTEYLNKKTAALSAENQDIIFENDYAEPDEVEGSFVENDDK